MRRSCAASAVSSMERRSALHGAEVHIDELSRLLCDMERKAAAMADAAAFRGSVEQRLHLVGRQERDALWHKAGQRVEQQPSTATSPSNRTTLSGSTLGRVTASRKPNRGPKAAAGNRQALVAAALEVFAEGGIEAPLSAIAKRAG